MSRRYLAFDLGAESGRAVAGQVADGRIHLEEVHRFQNRPVVLRGTLTWDLPSLIGEIYEGLLRFSHKYESPPDGISCDSWGVDFGLLDTRGNLLGNPVHYRDHRTDGMPERVFSRKPVEEIYRVTGTQFMQLNTLFQIEALEASEDPQWSMTDRFLLMADLVHYFLSGAQVVESSLASTTHLYSATERTWSQALIEELGYPFARFPEIVPSSTRVGTLDEEIVESLGLSSSFRNTPVIASLSHDTAAAVAAVPADSSTRWAYLSSGTWSLLGVELPDPILTEEARKRNFTNEGGAESTVRFLKNIMGLWILQECRRTWEKETGADKSYEEIAREAAQAPPRKSMIDPDDPRFFPPGDMPVRIQDYCRKTEQPVPEGIGAVARCVLESLAFKYRYTLETIEQLTGKGKIEILHIVGGGGKNRLLNQIVADVIGIPVVVGPTEATAAGNILAQAVAMNEVKGLWEGREMVGRSFEIERYQPEDPGVWEESYQRFVEMLGTE